MSESTFEVPAPNVFGPDLPEVGPDLPDPDMFDPDVPDPDVFDPDVSEKPAPELAPRNLILSVIIPARDEEDCIGACLSSLVAQSENFFELGREWEIVLVDDGSTDRTRTIAEEFSGIKIIAAPKLEKGWTGKANACWAGAQATLRATQDATQDAIQDAIQDATQDATQQATQEETPGGWLLFTDADTVHEPGNLRRAIFEAEKAKVGMLSYSPRQLVSGFWQSALMPLIFSELALAYPPEKVSNPESRLAAANGQFLLVTRAAYRTIGGHAAVADSILEDVELAHLAKRRKVGLRFRYAADALATRMYRSFGQMFEGWTKNLALLFSNCLATAAWKLLDLGLLAGLPLLALAFWHQPISRWALLLLWARTLWRFYSRVAKSNFSALDCGLSAFALPLFATLLWRSWFHHTVLKRVVWKGREYSG